MKRLLPVLMVFGVFLLGVGCQTIPTSKFPKNGPWVLYHSNGQLWVKGEYIKGLPEGNWVRYHENGQLSSKGTYKDNKRNGQWIHYDKSGKKKYGPHKSGMYKDDQKISD